MFLLYPRIQYVRRSNDCSKLYVLEVHQVHKINVHIYRPLIKTQQFEYQMLNGHFFWDGHLVFKIVIRSFVTIINIIFDPIYTVIWVFNTYRDTILMEYYQKNIFRNLESQNHNLLLSHLHTQTVDNCDMFQMFRINIYLNN